MAKKYYFFCIILVALFSCKKDCPKNIAAAHIPLCDTLSDLNFLNFKLFPNPATVNFIVQYTLPDTAFLKASMSDITGRLRLVFINETETKGVYQKYISLDSTITNGVYLVKFEVCNKTLNKKLVVTK